MYELGFHVHRQVYKLHTDAPGLGHVNDCDTCMPRGDQAATWVGATQSINASTCQCWAKEYTPQSICVIRACV
jgi:hypothetical protein